ncbi:hypothetical protein EON80_16870 [bacterium]|nr:MAG: hypothetical protein EON80_16870 [bacterium]
MAFILSGLGLLVADSILPKVPTYSRAEILDKRHTPARRETGFGPVTSSNGMAGAYYPLNPSTERWEILLESNTDELLTAKTIASRFFDLQVGQNVSYVVWRGRITGGTYATEVL